MKPLTDFEMQELTDAMTANPGGVPVGSLWTSELNPDIMFMVLLHANLPTEAGPIPSLVMQAIPSGESWIQPLRQFMEGDWENIGFVWDRDGRD